MSETATPSAINPFPWKALGVRQGKGAEWLYLIRVHDRDVEFPGRVLHSISSLLLLDPEVTRWRTMFPGDRKRSGINLHEAFAFIARECWAEQGRVEQAKAAA